MVIIIITIVISGVSATGNRPIFGSFSGCVHNPSSSAMGSPQMCAIGSYENIDGFMNNSNVVRKLSIHVGVIMTIGLIQLRGHWTQWTA